MRTRAAVAKLVRPLPPNFAIAGQVLGRIFAELHLGASLLEVVGSDRPWEWRAIHATSDVSAFELAYGVERRRSEYNSLWVTRVYREGRLVVGQHGGFFDLFAPIGDPRAPRGVLITGPFALARPKTSDLLSRWRWLTGEHGRASDPEFSHYAALTLSMTTFAGARFGVFKRLVRRSCDLLSERGNPGRLLTELETLAAELGETRTVERMWEAARTMIDERTWRTWQSPHKARELSELGAKSPPEHVVVGLLRGPKQQTDSVDDLLARDAFQRGCVELARQRGGVVCGRVGDHGVVLLCTDAGKGTRLLSKLLELGARVRAIARKHGLGLHLGIATAHDSPSLPPRYRSALSAAEEALSRGASSVHAETAPSRALTSPLGELRRALAAAVADGPGVLASRFARYAEAVTARSGYRLEPTRAYLEAGLDQLTDALRISAALEERSITELRASLERAAAEAGTVEELLVAYRSIISDIELAVSRPDSARQDRSIRRAIEFIRDHLSEPLSLAKVARTAGFAPDYFSKVFLQSEGIHFRRYLRQHRVERAKQMLIKTKLRTEQIGLFCGFGSRTHFHRAFTEFTGMAPTAFRKRGTARVRVKGQ